VARTNALCVCVCVCVCTHRTKCTITFAAYKLGHYTFNNTNNFPWVSNSVAVCRQHVRSIGVLLAWVNQNYALYFPCNFICMYVTHLQLDFQSNYVAITLECCTCRTYFWEPVKQRAVVLNSTYRKASWNRNTQNDGDDEVVTVLPRRLKFTG
jgi:hypothetical protein